MVTKKLSEVDYVIHMPDRRKQRRVCHLNMLKEYYEDCLSHAGPDRVTTVAITTQVTPENTSNKGGEKPIDDEIVGIDIRLRKSDVLANLENKLSHLSMEERREVTELVHLFPVTLNRTMAVMHDVDVGDASPCRQHPYRINPQKLLQMQKEIEYMLENDLIEPSNSDWSLPCILVPKPDDSYRFCTDFRKLNAVTKGDTFPIPRIDDCIDGLIL